MTLEEAIDIFEDNHTVLYTHGDYTEDEENKALAIAIEALRKQIPMQVIEIVKDEFARCPKCKVYIRKYDYCPECGQALKWKGESE